MDMKKILNIIYLCVFVCIITVSCQKDPYENDGHEHTYSDSWQYDDNYHWKKTICNGSWDCKVRISQKERHNTGNWKPDTEAINATGKITEKKECSVCGRKITRTSEFPVFEAINSEGTGVKLKFYLPENTRQITIYKSTGNSNFTYYSRISTWYNAPFSEKEIEWNDPYVKNGEDYYYYFYSNVSDNGTGKFSGNSDTLKIKSNGGVGDLVMTNEPEGYYDEATNSFIFTTFPEYSIPECKTRLLFYTEDNQTWWTGTSFDIISPFTFNLSNWPFDNNTEMKLKSFGITGDITYSTSNASWPYEGKGELFYRTMEGGKILQNTGFTVKKP
ncbi:MAG: hypothetical protein MJ162_03995 [Treponema sp.]|nr:hypothetical protein [Treponema sp.]